MRNPPLGIEIDDGVLRVPAHVVPLKIGGKQFSGFLLTALDGRRSGRRDTIVIKNVSGALNKLPGHIRATWQDFVREIKDAQQKWRLRGMATLKRSVRLHRADRMFKGLKIAEVGHHFGTVPALEIGQVNGYRIALFADELKDELGVGEMTDRDHVELLKSLETDLPALFRSYYEQIANYLAAVFFATDESKTLNFCLRVRTIIAASIRSKIDEICDLDPRFGEASRLAAQLREQYATELEEAKAVEKLSLILVNYIYGFFCVRQRALDYHTELAALFGGADLYEISPVAFLKRCGEQVLHPDLDGEFLRMVDRLRPLQDGWLNTLGVISAFVAEIRRATNNEQFDAPRVFVSHHFRVRDSVGLVHTLVTAMERNRSSAKLVLGRHIPQSDIRWALLARVWISDYQILVLPTTWQKEDGGIKNLKESENWVNLEILYGRLIRRELSFLVGAPLNESLVEDFRQHILRYTEMAEIAQIDPGDWARFIGGAKREIHESLHNSQCILSPVDAMAPANWDEFKRKVLDAAARKLIQMMFHAWRYFFEAEPWSIVQLMLEASKQLDREFSVDDITRLAWDKAHNADRRYAWISRRYANVEKLRAFLADKVRDIARFEFNLSEGVFPPLELVGRRPTVMKVRVMELFRLLCAKYQLSYDSSVIERIWGNLCEGRTE